jgi:hypothetical protein
MPSRTFWDQLRRSDPADLPLSGGTIALHTKTSHRRRCLPGGHGRQWLYSWSSGLSSIPHVLLLIASHAGRRLSADRAPRAARSSPVSSPIGPFGRVPFTNSFPVCILTRAGAGHSTDGYTAKRLGIESAPRTKPLPCGNGLSKFGPQQDRGNASKRLGGTDKDIPNRIRPGLPRMVRRHVSMLSASCKLYTHRFDSWSGGGLVQSRPSRYCGKAASLHDAHCGACCSPSPTTPVSRSMIRKARNRY